MAASLIAVAVAVSPAFGVVDRLLALLGDDPRLSGALVDRVQAVASLRSSWGKRATLWEAPTESGADAALSS